MVKYILKSNELKLTSSTILIECELGLPKHKLPFVKKYEEVIWSKSDGKFSSCYYIKWKYDLVCYKLYERTDYDTSKYYGYRIVIDYKNYHLVKLIIKELKEYLDEETFILTIIVSLV